MATERLSMRQTREILRQKWHLGRTHREVAQSLGISTGAVCTTVLRARGPGPIDLVSRRRVVPPRVVRRGGQRGGIRAGGVPRIQWRLGRRGL